MCDYLLSLLCIPTASNLHCLLACLQDIDLPLPLLPFAIAAPLFLDQHWDCYAFLQHHHLSSFSCHMIIIFHHWHEVDFKCSIVRCLIILDCGSEGWHKAVLPLPLPPTCILPTTGRNPGPKCAFRVLHKTLGLAAVAVAVAVLCGIHQGSTSMESSFLEEPAARGRPCGGGCSGRGAL